MTTLVQVKTPELDGVKIRRHVLDHEASRLAGIAQRLGKRLSYWLRSHPVHKLPDRDWLESYALYERVVMNLLREQRARAALTPDGGRVPLSDAEFEAELRTLVTDTIMSLPDAELERLLASRASVAATAGPTASSTAATPPPLDPPVSASATENLPPKLDLLDFSRGRER